MNLYGGVVHSRNPEADRRAKPEQARYDAKPTRGPGPRCAPSSRKYSICPIARETSMT